MRRLRQVISSPLRVAMLVLVLHGAWIGAYLAAGHEARDFIKIGVRFLERSHASKRIRFDPTYRYPANHAGPQGTGYDGQFAYYMALDLPKARYYMDVPAYRYTRLLYPLIATGLALGSATAIPYALILVNWLAIGGGTLALAAWLRRRRAPPAVALLFGLSPGIVIGLQRDLSEPLAYALVAAAIWTLDFAPRRRLVGASVLFALAALARQTTVVFPLVYGIGMLLGANPRSSSTIRANAPRAVGFMACSIGPIVAYTAAVSAWLGPGASSNLFEPVPFRGFLGLASATPAQQSPVILLATAASFIVLPSLLAAAVAWRAVRAPDAVLPRSLLFLNVALFVVLLNRAVFAQYTSSSRATVSVMLSAALCMPYLRRPVTQRAMLAMGSAGALWLVMTPVLFVYGFSALRV